MGLNYWKVIIEITGWKLLQKTELNFSQETIIISMHLFGNFTLHGTHFREIYAHEPKGL